MKKFFFSLSVCFFLFAMAVPPVFSFDHHSWNQLLEKHVAAGEADYKGFLADRAELEQYLASIAELSIQTFSEYSREERLALWLNVFNATVIQTILHYYPVDSIEKIPGFWNVKRVKIAGMSYSLQEVRDMVVRRGFRDERATLCLVSGMKSSGPLREEAYDGARLTEQLRDQMNAFLSDERYNQIKPKQKKIKVSPLLKDLAQDFVLGYGSADSNGKFSAEDRAVLGFIRIHVQDSALKAWIETGKCKIRYLPADTSLNETGETS